MPRNLLSALAVTGVVLITACERSPQQSVLEPAYGLAAEPANPCPTILGLAVNDDFTSKYEIVQQLYVGIDGLFQDMRSRNGAKSHVDNIVREVCAGDYAGAAEFVHNFIQQVEGQPDDKLDPGLPHVADLVNWVQVLARPMANDVLPEGALGYEGALAITPGGTGADAVRTRNGHVIINASDFPGGEPFVVAIAPGAGHFGSYIVYGGESYQVVTDHPEGSNLSGDGVMIVFCGTYPPNLVIAHDKGELGVEVLVTEPIDCADYAPSSSALLDAAPSWLRSLARLGSGSVRSLFGPAPLYARVETGLGGRTKSFSPFALVTPQATLTLTCESRLAGTINLFVGAAAVCADGAGDGPTVTTVQLPVGSVTVTAQAVNYSKRHDIWYSSGNLALDPLACPPKWQSTASKPASCTFTLPPAGGSLYVKLTGY